MYFAITNGAIQTDGKLVDGHALVVKDGIISAIIPQDSLPADVPVVDLNGQILVPGFIDLQVNGGNGVLFNDEPKVESIRKIAEAHWQFGTTSLLPTLISEDLSKISQAIDAVDAAIDAKVPGIIGIHVEGPFLNNAKRGIHNADKIRKSDREGLDAIRATKNGRTLVTLAPECMPASHIREMRERGIIICAGHTNATYDELTEAFNQGVDGVTHLFNAMSPLGSREPGAVGAALDSANCWCCIIADGPHVHPATLRIAIRAKGGTDRFILVSDAMPTVGMTEKSFVLNGEKITVIDDVCKNAEGTLAGSDLDMATAVRNAQSMLGLNLTQAVTMASANPAKLLEIENKIGSLSIGKFANMVALNEEGEVQKTWIEGQIMWSRQA